MEISQISVDWLRSMANNLTAQAEALMEQAKKYNDAADAIYRESGRDKCCVCGEYVDLAKPHNWDRELCRPRHPGC